MQMPRDHHYGFAHKYLPKQIHNNPDQFIKELKTPLGGTFLAFMWDQVGQQLGNPPIPHVGVGRRPGAEFDEVLKLENMGIVEIGDWTVAVMSMPATEAQGEAMYASFACHNTDRHVRYFVYEHSSQPGKGNLGEWAADGSRVGYGLHEGVELDDFVRAFAPVIDLPPDPLIAGLAAFRQVIESTPLTPGMLAGAGGAGGPVVSAEAGNRVRFVGRFLQGTILTLLILTGLVWFLFPVIAGPLAGIADQLFNTIAGAVSSGFVEQMLFSGPPEIVFLDLLKGFIKIVIGFTLLVWVYKVFNAMKGRANYGPGFAVGSWFIPVLNFIFIPLVLRDAVRSSNPDKTGGNIAFVWMLFHLIHTVLTTLFAGSGGIPEGAFPPAVFDMLPLIFQLNFYSGILAYGLLWHMVRTVNNNLIPKN